MLSEPDCGWTDFQLDGTSTYGLSFLDDIAFEWLDRAIYGLETLRPFCVKGFLEPGRFLCTVSYWNCHILVEKIYDKEPPLQENNVVYECSHTSMIEFCKYLYVDINAHVNKWTGFAAYDCDEETEEGLKKLEANKAELEQKLARLKALIEEKEYAFGEGYCFL